jgi:dTDP-glucose 4,6-dehydratase
VTRAVISGAAGFIASHLCDRMLDRGWDVVGLDNLVTGSATNVEHLRDHPRFRLVTHDVSQPFEVDGAVDYVLHFASPASPVDFPAIPIQIVKVGTLGTHNMLGLARAKGARFLLASTSEVYGDPLVHPQPETYWGNVNPVGPRGCYDEAKRCAEAFTMAYYRTHGLETRIVRIFNTYGPRMAINDGRVVSNFCVAALRGEDLEIYGDGNQTRSFAYVDDIIDAIVRMMNQEGHIGPVNIGNPDEFTIAELARLAIELSGSSSKVVVRPPRPDDPVRRKPNIDLARKVLGWEPKTPLRGGLEKSIQHFREVLDTAKA